MFRISGSFSIWEWEMPAITVKPLPLCQECKTVQFATGFWRESLKTAWKPESSPTLDNNHPGYKIATIFNII